MKPLKTLRKLPILRMLTQIYTIYAIHDLRINAKITQFTLFTQKHSKITQNNSMPNICPIWMGLAKHLL